MSEPAAEQGRRRLGVVRTMEDLHAIMRARVKELEVTLQSVGRAGMLPTRYANKLLAPSPNKRFGMLSIPSLMEALQFELHAIERTDVPKRITDKLDKTQFKGSERSVRHVRTLSKRFLRKIAKAGGRARAANMGVRARSLSARKAGLARQATLSPAERKILMRRVSLARWAKRSAATTAPCNGAEPLLATPSIAIVQPRPKR